ncbi:DUF6223 family protein [Actinokineospora sp. UTMC 2448]|uniref:DUF6223 family protein n=1 Tax=Actinokineospora sp. UTMC 2448 TaxID=2268449 RepID=UPI002164E295|nr:DUF6223 family protein [Actinokineospora sp. UTMC 2448]UVS78563.1 hypothetical protein Actkin_02297 [Actinokineospora sp. UTMC 2448]
MSVAFVAQVCTTQAECASQGVDTFVGTPARIWASVAALVALASVVTAWLALARPRRIGRKAAIAALVAGTVAAVNGAVNLAVADGGLGTGNGVAGGAIALALGLTAATLSWRALARSRTTEPIS